MRSNATAVILVLCLSALIRTSALGDPPDRYSRQLAVEADALLGCAIRWPYGWAWDSTATAESARQPLPHAVAMDSLGTPAAGLVLLWTGQFLGEPRYIAAAEEAARAVGAAQMPTGRVHANPIFGSVAGGREPQSPVANRTATNAALGLLLACIEMHAPATQSANAADGETTDVDPHVEALRSSAARCAHWLARQETPNGLWPSVYPPGPATADTIRLIRLDSPNYRNSTLALLLGFELLHDDTLHHFAARPLDGLLKLRLTSDVHGPGLWCTACTVDGTDIPTGFPNGPDVLASRYAMETLLGGELFTQDPDIEPALDAAVKTLSQSKRPDGQYDRFLNPAAAADMSRALGIDPEAPPTFFAQPTTIPTKRALILADSSLSGTFHIPELIDAVGRLKAMGPDPWNAALASGIPTHQQIEAGLCGLLSDPFTLDFPGTTKEVPAFLAAHREELNRIEGPPPTDLAGRVKRLWALLLRAKLERLAR